MKIEFKEIARLAEINGIKEVGIKLLKIALKKGVVNFKEIDNVVKKLVKEINLKNKIIGK